MGKQKRSVEFIANNTPAAIELKDALVKRGLDVNHIYTGSSVPILIDNENYTIGSGNIRINYLIFNEK
jgi:hypothetical protein